MPNDRDWHPVLNPATDRVAAPPSGPATWALADGVGIYSAPAGSPFLTAPLPSNRASGSPDPISADLAGTPGDQLRALREPLRREVQGVPLRSRLSEEEISGLVTAALDVIARHLCVGYDRATHGQVQADDTEQPRD